jgi:predicted  nucleic acid-binding Zn-ribbon protein
MYDAKQQEFLREEAHRLNRTLAVAMGEISQLKANAKADHHLIIVLRETISDLRKELETAKRGGST